MINSKEGLTRFYKKTKFVQRASEEDFADGLARELAESGKEIASIYFRPVTKSVRCSVEQIFSGSYKVVAHDTSDRKHIAFIEYGTGVKGDGTYAHDLPQSNIPFTGSWVYDFRYKERHIHWIGKEAESPMLNSFIELQDSKNSIVKQYIERESAKYE
jgi:hypothetical protein